MPLILNGTTGISGTDGSASIPAVQGTDANTGMFFPAADTIAFAEGGTEVMRINASGQVEYTLGTASLPSITATGDTNTGIYFPAADQIAFTEGGTEAMRINASGNVGIGTASPYVGCRLTVNGNLSVAGNSIVGGDSSAFTLNLTGGTTFSTNGAAIALRGSTAGFNNHGMEFYAGGSERARISSGGTFSIGTTNDLGRVTVGWNNVAQQGMGFLPTTGTFNGSPIVFYNNSFGVSGFIGQGETFVSYNTGSDYRLKHDVVPLTNGLATIGALKPSTYRWNVNNSHGEGFIAHELAEHIPLAVTGEKDAVNEDGSIKPQAVDYSKIVVHLVAAVQELKAENDALKARIAALEAR
jgi:hypothetical protein